MSIIRNLGCEKHILILSIPTILCFVYMHIICLNVSIYVRASSLDLQTIKLGRFNVSRGDLGLGRVYKGEF